MHLLTLTVLSIAFLSLTTAQFQACKADNCLRAVRRSSAQLGPFCSTYLSFPAPSVTTSLPAFATTACANLPSRISSACQCLQPTSTPTTPSPSAPPPTTQPTVSPSAPPSASPSAPPYTLETHHSPCCICCAFAGYATLPGAASDYSFASASALCQTQCSARDACRAVYVEKVDNEGDESWNCIFKDAPWEQGDTDCAALGLTPGGTCVEIGVWG